MERTISDTTATVLCKFVLPGLANVVFVPVAGLCLVRAGDEPVFILVALFGIWVALSSLWRARSLKRVTMDDLFLYTHSGSIKYRTPFTNIARIEESVSQWDKTATIWLNQPEDFGSKITFLPQPERDGLFAMKYPVLDELRIKASIPIQTFRRL